ncbi:MAG: hypothetical protein HY560_03815 [Gemmatimonadetes bacterium]|nr:hypothetical protein [Gemmatimonadota bacterium]
MTAKLSRQFYDKFGDEVTNELVNLLNQVDAASRDELRELNEANARRFEAKLEQFSAAIRADVARLESKFEQRTAELRAELLKWMFLFWATSALAVISLSL